MFKSNALEFKIIDKAKYINVYVQKFVVEKTNVVVEIYVYKLRKIHQ